MEIKDLVKRLLYIAIMSLTVFFLIGDLHFICEFLLVGLGFHPINEPTITVLIFFAHLEIYNLGMLREFLILFLSSLIAAVTMHDFRKKKFEISSPTLVVHFLFIFLVASFYLATYRPPAFKNLGLYEEEYVIFQSITKWSEPMSKALYIFSFLLISFVIFKLIYPLLPKKYFPKR